MDQRVQHCFQRHTNYITRCKHNIADFVCVATHSSLGENLMTKIDIIASSKLFLHCSKIQYHNSKNSSRLGHTAYNRSHKDNRLYCLE